MGPVRLYPTASMSVILPPWRPQLAPATGDADLTWAYPWPAGERLATDLPALLDVRGLPIAELGCGRGHSGLTCLALGAARVLFCDLHEEPLAYVRTALAINGFDSRGRTGLHRWGEPLPDGPWPLILGADILYRPDFHARLLTSIALGLAPDGLALLADPRRELEPDLPELARHAGLTRDTERRPGPYTLVRLHPAIQ